MGSNTKKKSNLIAVLNLNLMLKNYYYETDAVDKLNHFYKKNYKQINIFIFLAQPSKNYHSSAYILPRVHGGMNASSALPTRRSSYSIFFSYQPHCLLSICHLHLWSLDSRVQGQPLSLQKVSPFTISFNILDFNKFKVSPQNRLQTIVLQE